MESPEDAACYAKLRKVVPAMACVQEGLVKAVAARDARIAELEARCGAQAAVLAQLGVLLPTGDEGQAAAQSLGRAAAERVLALKAGGGGGGGGGGGAGSKRNASSSSSGGNVEDSPDVRAAAAALSARVGQLSATSSERLAQQLSLALAVAELATRSVPGAAAAGPLGTLHKRAGAVLAQHSATLSETRASALKRAVDDVQSFAKRARLDAYGM